MTEPHPTQARAHGQARARVFAERGLAGRYWVYEAGRHSGVRMTWREAFTAAQEALAWDTTSGSFSIQPASLTISVLRAEAAPP